MTDNHDVEPPHADPHTGIIDRTHIIPEQSEADEAKAFDIEEYMRDVIDPELGINVVDLGLVYDIWIENENEAHINMTLTSPACPLTDVLEDQAQSAVVGNGGIEKLQLNWVWNPPWGPHMITEEGREQLRALGFSV
ncbi:metal-sulfur cluster assembly factor [Corynebacterium sp. ES2794-CONJ1]|uniref:metal-sulfur cluster assembly factor n=1 Tax=unclassified Corynebacterium TaxID=2624378 RepID=UPI0021698D6A|nr:MULTISPECIES: metal-sulfur cluster assembly factor [unclassified Corynebacterium]MCS4489305.1 metal-sulfur cluster assembly factor [Corynebacterium sp. ES2775-CONJ]MCS4491118.1 metal-sulfur cluster assembly factor [Corynebacterium sp. ES2715-CONJ3]MCS4531001.1 metal-sulfur cluster assembly factor [Corynebacterium sp. ES2730-CONJ]MCU9518368.1 metal-sulfur cluster assembly factor [Corynebacterium sp. ES2794-CONJ1]